MAHSKSPQNLTQDRLKERLHYDPETGIFTWRERASSMTPAGATAGYRRDDGYIEIGIEGGRWLAHRLAFLYTTGLVPAKEVDHINGVRDDNRWANLREVTSQENKQNLGGARSHNISGILGVRWTPHARKWNARITVDGLERHLGYFTTPELASAAYLKAKDELHPTHRRLRSAA